MTDRSDFVADPVAFMKKHVVLQWVNITASRPLVVTITEKPNLQVASGGRPGAKVFVMTDICTDVPRGEKMPIHWIGFGTGRVVSGVLDSRSKYMFTYAMDGCTFGAGSQSGDGCCVVAHANAKGMVGNDGTSGTQRALQRTQLQSEPQFGGDPNLRVMSSLQYQELGGQGLKKKATNFAVLGPTGYWRFYTHSWMKLGTTTYLHGGCSEAAMVPPGVEELLGR